MSGVSKRDHSPPTGQTPGKKASKRRAVNSKKSSFQGEEPEPDVKVCIVS